HDPGERGQVVLLDGAFGGDEHRTGADGDLTGHGRGQFPTLTQRFESGHLLQGGVGTHALVAFHTVHRRDLFVEVSGFQDLAGALVALQGDLLQLRTLVAPLLAHELCTAELGDLLCAVALVPAFTVQTEAVVDGELDVGAHGDHAHVLHTGRHDEVLGTRHHA